MSRYYQTLARVGSGITATLMLVWFLWPTRTWQFEPEAFFAFAVATVFWVSSEFKLSEEVIYRNSTKNDIRFGREIFAYGTWTFRELLKDHDYYRGIHPRLLEEASLLVKETDLGIAHFQDKRVQSKYIEFSQRLKAFVEFFGAHSSPEKFGSIILQSIVPVTEFDDVSISEHYQIEIDEVNRLATEAWKSMQPLVFEIKVRIPEVFDEPFRAGWIRSADG